MFSKIPKRILQIFAVLVILGLIGFVITSRFRHPSSFTVKVDRTAVITQMRSLARLETASFTIEQVIDAQTNDTGVIQKFLFGDKILLIAHGQVIAGVDLSQISQKDIAIDGTSIAIELPKPEIFITTLDNSKTKVYDRNQGVLKRNDTELESAAREEAEKAIYMAACEGGILDVAAQNAKRNITALLQGLGFELVQITMPKGSC